MSKVNVFSRKKGIARLYVGGRWEQLPEESGPIGKTGLELCWQKNSIGSWNLRKATIRNVSDRPIALGACHLIEYKDIQNTGKDDKVFLDSGGGWFSGVQDVMATQPNGEYEYWNDLFIAEEDLAWAKRVQMGDVSCASHYSLGGMAAYYRTASGDGFCGGFVLPFSKFTAIPIMLNDHATGKLRAFALSCNFAGYELEPGESVESEEAIWGAFADVQKSLEDYASFCAERRNIHLRHQTPPVGWLSWYGYRLTIDENEINRIADFIQQEYPGFGFKYMQIDLGYNKNNLPGEWFETNDHFPHGLEAFVENMRKRGYVPGLWCALYQACESCEFLKEHPDAHLTSYQKKDGNWYWEPYDKSFNLDPTEPLQAAFMKKVIRYFKGLGIKYFKVDFMNRLARTDKDMQPYDKKVGRGAGVYREALKLIVNELDPEDYFYTCSNLVMHSIGLCSTSMTACDIGNTGFGPDALEGKMGKFNFFARQFTSTMSRYFIHNKLLLLNPDAIVIAPPANAEEAWMRILFVGISGGQVFLGDKFDLNTPEIRRMVREVLPPTGIVGRPINFFQHACPNEYPEVFHLHTKEREVFAVFNMNNREKIDIDLKAAGLNPRQQYYVWDYKARKYLGIASGSFTVSMPFPAARVYAFTPVTDKPCVIGTTFHFLQGEVELSKVHCTRNGKLVGYLNRPAGDTGSVFIYKQGKVHELKLTGTGKPTLFSL